MTEIIQCPKCGSQARFSMGGIATLAFQPLAFDENGNIENLKNPNTYRERWECRACGCSYTSREENGKIVIQEGSF